MRWSDQQHIDVSIVVPTLNEAANLPTLLHRIDDTMVGRSYEVVIVDDASADDTNAVCSTLGRQYPLQLFVRTKPENGLSGAVLYGLARTRGNLLVVMDADLQHPPEQIPDLLTPLEHNEAEFVIGSRYVAGGSTDGKWGALRRLNSWAATFLARPFAGHTRDPMSGFFALRRETYERAGQLNPIGYKIALELMCKCRVRKVCEVPIHFGVREAGESKLSVKQQVRYLDHLSRLYDFSFPIASPLAKFVIATGCAWLIAFGLYVRLVAQNVSPVRAPTLAFIAAVLMTAAIHMRSLRRYDRPILSRRAWSDFSMLIIGEWSICTLAAHWVGTHIEHLTVSQFFVVTFGAAAIARYTLRAGLLHNLQGVREGETEKPASSDALKRRDAA
jgi:glycosyltransferase involved in cell wall biosynthesis